MTHQEFNNIYYQFTSDEKGIKPYDTLKTSGYELKEFVEFAVKKTLDKGNLPQTEIRFGY